MKCKKCKGEFPDIEVDYTRVRVDTWHLGDWSAQANLCQQCVQNLLNAIRNALEVM